MCLPNIVAFISLVTSLTSTICSVGCFGIVLYLVIDANSNIIPQLNNYEAIVCLIGLAISFTRFISTCVLYSRYIIARKIIDKHIESRKNTLLGFSD